MMSDRMWKASAIRARDRVMKPTASSSSKNADAIAITPRIRCSMDMFLNIVYGTSTRAVKIRKCSSVWVVISIFMALVIGHGRPGPETSDPKFTIYSRVHTCGVGSNQIPSCLTRLTITLYSM